MNQTRIWWAGNEKGWILETRNPISQAQFIKIWEYTLRDQKRQIALMSDGPERSIYKNAYGHLMDMKVTQNIKPQGGAN